MDIADRLHACHSAVVHDVMKDLGLPIRVLPRTIVGLEPTMAIRVGEDPQAAYMRFRVF